MNQVVVDFGRYHNKKLLMVILIELEAFRANSNDVRLIRVQIINFLINQIQYGALVLTML